MLEHIILVCLWVNLKGLDDMQGGLEKASISAELVGNNRLNNSEKQYDMEKHSDVRALVSIVHKMNEMKRTLQKRVAYFLYIYSGISIEGKGLCAIIRNSHQGSHKRIFIYYYLVIIYLVYA